MAYLKSVESPGDFEKKDYMTKVSFNKDEFLKILKEDLKVLPDDSFQPIEDIKKSEGGNVIETKIYGVQILSKDLRRIFNLKSTAFDVVFENDVFMFTVYGNGHGVGMSQYGANGFAKDGMKYDEILSHYYSGIEIKRI